MPYIRYRPAGQKPDEFRRPLGGQLSGRIVFTTMEGGAVVSHDPEIKHKLDLLRNSGIAGEDSVPLAGIITFPLLPGQVKKSYACLFTMTLN